jgi:hypothetical protein
VKNANDKAAFLGAVTLYVMTYLKRNDDNTEKLGIKAISNISIHYEINRLNHL